ncbi:MAG: threonine/serine exporter family protein [Acidobacteria bacterium]|nr:threonine/serine exporter family protein [Acidobacteriota bacterium]
MIPSIQSSEPELTGVDHGKRSSTGFILRLGRALHAYGYPAHSLEEALGKVSQRLGIEGQFFSTPTSIFAAFGPQDDQHTFLLRVEPGEVNLSKLAELDKVAGEVLRGSLDPEEGSCQIEKILAEPLRYGRFLRAIAFGLASAAASRFLGGGLKEIAVSAFIGCAIAIMSILTERSQALGRVFEPLAAFAASALTAGLSFIVGPYAVSNAMLAGLIVLMPGLTLTIAMIELSTQHLSSGTARLNKSFVVFLGIGFGVAVGSSVMTSIFGTPRIARATPLPLWSEIIALICMPLALTVLLRAKSRDAIWIVISGALAFGGARIGALWLGPELGVFLGALTVGIASSLYARWLDRPAIITQVPGILLLVPGSVGFRGLAALLDKQIVSGVDTSFKMIITAVALVAGTLIANVIAPVKRDI